MTGLERAARFAQARLLPCHQLLWWHMLPRHSFDNAWADAPLHQSVCFGGAAWQNLEPPPPPASGTEHRARATARARGQVPPRSTKVGILRSASPLSDLFRGGFLTAQRFWSAQEVAACDNRAVHSSTSSEPHPPSSCLQAVCACRRPGRRTARRWRWWH